MAENNHVTEEDLTQLHKQGACLTRHQRRTEGHLCSHQDQARLQAEAHPLTYNYPAYYTLCDWKPGGIFRTAARSAKFPPNYGELWPGLGYFWKNKPTHQGKEWDLGKGHGKWKNFHHFAKPYWHNAHHIIANGALSAAIADAAEEAKDARLINLIKAGLLKASYNLNDKINMIILPMEKIVATALALPRHLKRDEVGPDDKGEFRSHDDYSKKVKIKLKSIMRSYKQILAKALEPDHDGPPDAISKQQIVNLSEEIYNSIISAGGYIGGKSLSELKF